VFGAAAFSKIIVAAALQRWLLVEFFGPSETGSLRDLDGMLERPQGKTARRLAQLVPFHLSRRPRNSHSDQSTRGLWRSFAG